MVQIKISSVLYRAHEIVIMPSGTCLIHKGDRSGPIVGEQSSKKQAIAFVDRLLLSPNQGENS